MEYDVARSELKSPPAGISFPMLISEGLILLAAGFLLAHLLGA